VQARGGVAVARRGKAKPGRARGLFAPPAKQVLDRSDSKLGKRRRTADYDFGDVIMPPLPGAKAVAQLPVSSLVSAILMIIIIISLVITFLESKDVAPKQHDNNDDVNNNKKGRGFQSQWHESTVSFCQHNRFSW